MTNIREILAKNLKENRKKCGISQAKLAEKAQVSTQYIAMIETSRQYPTPEVLERIAAALNIEAYELFSILPTAETIVERLQKDIINEVRKVVTEILNKKIP